MKALSQPLFASLRGYDRAQLGPDLFSGALIALLSIPISMGYAQLAGLPPVYGLYGSLVPILLFAMLSTTREFIFGVDAALRDGARPFHREGFTRLTVRDGDGLAQATLFVRHITAPDGQRTACVALFGADGLPVGPKVDWY